MLAGSESSDYTIERLSASVAVRGFLNPDFILVKGSVLWIVNPVQVSSYSFQVDFSHFIAPRLATLK